MNVPTARTRKIPPLENGDHLTRDEFERRYEAMPGVKAELIEGVVFMSSPVRVTEHGEQHFDLVTWFGVYKAQTPGVRSGDNTTVRLGTTNEPQPDVMVFIDPGCGGQAAIDVDGYVRGAPELVAEVSASTATIDLNSKFDVYRRHGVGEYLVWRVYDDAIDWFVRRGAQYQSLSPDPADELLKSETFPGLWLDPAALVRRDLAAVLAALARGLASPEHAAFVRQLAARRQVP
jgi:Uma2 family endonuclease